MKQKVFFCIKWKISTRKNITKNILTFLYVVFEKSKFQVLAIFLFRNSTTIYRNSPKLCTLLSHKLHMEISWNFNSGLNSPIFFDFRKNYICWVRVGKKFGSCSLTLSRRTLSVGQTNLKSPKNFDIFIHSSWFFSRFRVVKAVSQCLFSSNEDFKWKPKSCF